MARILLIDDDPIILNLLTELLEEAGYEVVSADNGNSGTELFRKAPTDVIITDIIMPEKEGLSTIFEIKKDFPSVKIIAISGGGGGDSGDYLETAKEFGANYTFSKPVGKNEILSALDTLLTQNEDIPSHLKPKSTEHNILLCRSYTHDLDYLKKALADEFSLIETNTIQNALAILQSHKIDLIFIENHEPQMEGLVTANKIKIYTTNEVPFIFISDTFSASMVEQGYAIGAVDYLITPIPPEILKNKTRVLIQRNEQEQALKKQSQNLQTSLKMQCRISDNLIDTAKELKASKQQLEIVYSELERVNSVFQLFVPKPFLNRIAAQQAINSGRFEEENLTILFCDIRGYTRHAEKLTPNENFDFLNSFFSLMEPPITKNEGFIDKFIGDAILALFDQEDSAIHALKAAIEMQTTLQQYSDERVAQGLSEIKMGIGINTGTVMVGALGSANRLNSTVLGDHVNLGARLEELTKKFQVQILISEHSYKMLKPEEFQIREIDKVKIRGKSEPVVVYEVYDAEPLDLKNEKNLYQERFAQALKLYKNRQFKEALKLFQECLEVTCQDIVIYEYIKRCDYFQKHQPHKDWDGTVSDHLLLIEHDYRRRIPRYSLKVPIKIYLNLKEPFLEGVTVDVSLHGMKIESSHNFELGTILFMEVLLEPENLEERPSPPRVKILGKVIWSRTVSPSTYGLQITIATIEGKELFKRVLQSVETMEEPLWMEEPLTL